VPPASRVDTGTFGGRMTLSFFEDVDFDDGPVTEEHPRRGRRGRRGGGGEERPPRAPRPGGSAGPRRLAVAIVAAIVVLIVGWYWVKACQADAQKRAYENYVTDVNSVVKQSDDIGTRLDNALLDPTATKAKLVSTVSNLARQQSEVATSTAKLHDTGRLRGLQSWLETTMRYRTQGLEGLGAALTTALSKSPVELTDVTQASNAYERLLASDVVYSDSFQRPASSALTKANIKGVSLSDSQFALTIKMIDPSYLRQLLQRAVSNGSGSSSTGTGAIVGTQLLKVVVLPKNQQLIPGSHTNSFPSTPNLTYKVFVKNSGEELVTNVEVRFIEGAATNHPPQIAKIRSITPGGVESVLFTPKFPTLGIPSKITVRAVPVKGEKDPSNNEATYTVDYMG
jgi:hypothetical protein